MISIQYLRALAAIGVAAHHTGWMHTDLGAAGVDVFFVISGFIMVHVSRREAAPLTFLRARVLRVAPLYWIALALTAATSAHDLRRVLLSFAFWPHYDETGAIFPILAPGWSLNDEMFFYALFAACLLLPERRRVPALTACLGALIAAGLALHPSDAAARAWTDPAIAEFAAGAWLCLLHRSGRLPKGWAAVSLTATGAALFALQARGAPFAAPQAVRWGVPAAMIVAGALGIEQSGRLPRVPALRLMGDASYSLYLSHIFTLTVLMPALLDLPALVAAPIAVGGCCLVGAALHKIVEQPLRNALSPRPKPVVRPA